MLLKGRNEYKLWKEIFVKEILRDRQLMADRGLKKEDINMSPQKRLSSPISICMEVRCGEHNGQEKILCSLKNCHNTDEW